MLASLNTMANTSTKIAKSFVGLSTTNIAIRRRHVIFPHLEAKYAQKKKKKTIKMKSTQKTRQEAPRLQKVKPEKCQRSKLVKVNRKPTVNGLC